VIYRWGQWLSCLSYEEFRPEQIGHALHDRVNHLGIAKACCDCTEALRVYGAVMIEDSGYAAQDGRCRTGVMALTGLEYFFEVTPLGGQPRARIDRRIAAGRETTSIRIAASRATRRIAASAAATGDREGQP